MSTARVETPSASSSNSSPASRAPASESVAPQVRIGERRNRKYAAAATETTARKRVSFIVPSVQPRRLPGRARTGCLAAAGRRRRSRPDVRHRAQSFAEQPLRVFRAAPQSPPASWPFPQRVGRQASGPSQPRRDQGRTRHPTAISPRADSRSRRCSARARPPSEPRRPEATCRACSGSVPGALHRQPSGHYGLRLR